MITTPHTTPHADPHTFRGVRVPRGAAVWGSAAVAAAAALSSFVYTAQFAADNGYSWGLCLLLPLTTDGLAAVAWYKAATTGSRWAWIWLWLASAASVTGNALGHLEAKSEALTVVAGGWPALCLAVVAHLLRPTRPAPPEVWAEVADTTKTSAVPAPAAAGAADTPDATVSGPAAPTPAPADRQGSAVGEPSGVGAADQRAVVEGAGTSLDHGTRGALAQQFESFRAATEPEELPVELSAWAATADDEALAEHARRADRGSVRKLLETYGVSHSRARRVAGLIRQGVTA